jgi:hypothetical protein
MMRGRAVWKVSALGVLLLLAGALRAEDQQDRPLTIEGSIDPLLAYKLRVDYHTTLDDRRCKFEEDITGMWVPMKESRYLIPKIEGTKHYLRDGLSHPEANGQCRWRAGVVSICPLSRQGAPLHAGCQPIFILREVPDKVPAAISIVCELSSGVCSGVRQSQLPLTIQLPQGNLRLDLSVGPDR